MREIIVLLLIIAATSHAFSKLGLAPFRTAKFLICSASAIDDAGRRLYDIAYKGDAEKLKVLVAEAKGNKNILNWRFQERYGRTPLVIASYYNRIEAVKILLATPGLPNLLTAIILVNSIAIQIKSNHILGSLGLDYRLMSMPMDADRWNPTSSQPG